MGTWQLQNIGGAVSNLAELEELDLEEQAMDADPSKIQPD
jgi:hypothetical protein